MCIAEYYVLTLETDKRIGDDVSCSNNNDNNKLDFNPYLYQCYILLPYDFLFRTRNVHYGIITKYTDAGTVDVIPDFKIINLLDAGTSILTLHRN